MNMFKRKNGVLAFLLVAVMLLGVGFAALTEPLSITGTATAVIGEDSVIQKTFEDAIGFVAATAGTGATNKTTLSEDAPVNDVVFEAAGFADKDDVVTITYTIANQHTDLAADVELTADAASDTYFEVTTDWEEATIAAGATKNIVVTVKMIKTPVDAKTYNFTLGFTANAKE